MTLHLGGGKTINELQQRRGAWRRPGSPNRNRRMSRRANAIPGGGAMPLDRKKKEQAASFDHYRVKEGSRPETAHSGTSVFDPVLTELAYRWFCPPGGTVLDPFAGGSVRGIVASVLGRSYVGIDLSARQIAANREQAATICREPVPQWIEGDSRLIRTLAAGVEADFIMGCPPYADLERYSDDPADLSTLDYADFRAAYRIIVAETCALLKPDRFACFVVGDVRDKKGFYYGFPWHTVEAFEAAGLRLYNEAVLVTAVGSLPIRAGKQFAATRKLGRTHQNVLCFVKGNPRVATRAIGECDFGDGGPGSTEETREVNEQPSGSDDEYGERL